MLQTLYRMRLCRQSCSFSFFLVWGFRLDKQSDAKRFFGPMPGTREPNDSNQQGSPLAFEAQDKQNGRYKRQGALMTITRREMCLLLPAVLSAAAAPLGEAGAQDNSLASGSFAFEKLPVKTAPSGVQTRAVFKGKLATGESIETHATTLPPGAMPHPPHHHVHSEMFCMREGKLELTVNGKSYRLEPGGVGFVRSNEEHGVKNVGATPANYFVVEMGPGAS